MNQSEIGGPYKPQPRCIAVFVRRIGGQPKAAVTPSVLVAYRGDEVIWDVICDEGGIEVQIGRFKSKPAGKQPPWAKGDVDRKVTTQPGGGVSVGDMVRNDASAADYKYSILLDGTEVLDPEVRIRETS